MSKGQKVYTVSFMGVSVYSTARKAIEAVNSGEVNWKDVPYTGQWQDHEAYAAYEKEQAKYDIDMEHKTEQDVKRLITLLKKSGYLHIKDGGDIIHIAEHCVR